MILHLLLAVCLANESFLQHSQQTLERLTSDFHDSSRRFPGFKLMRSLNQLKHMFQEMIPLLKLGRWQGRRLLQDMGSCVYNTDSSYAEPSEGYCASFSYSEHECTCLSDCTPFGTDGGYHADWCKWVDGGSEGTFCLSHDDCPSSTPFCFENVCALCDECHTCVDGIDGTCGSCGDGYPTQEEGPCEAEPETSCTAAETTNMMTCLLGAGLDPTQLEALSENPDITVICANIACFPECVLSQFPGGGESCDTVNDGYLTMPFPSCEADSMDTESTDPEDMDRPSKLTCGTGVMYMDEFADVASCEAGTDFLTRTVITNPLVVDDSCQIGCDGDKMTIPVECLADGIDNLDIGADMSSNMVSHMSKLETCADEDAGSMQTCVDGYLTIVDYDSDDCSANVVSEVTLSDACMAMDPTNPAVSMSTSCEDGYSISRMCKDDAEKFDEMVFRSVKLEANTCIENDDASSEMWTCAADKVTYTSYSDAQCATADGETWDLMTSGTCNNLQSVGDGNAIIATARCDADYVTIYQCEVYGEDGTAIDANTVTKNEDGSFSTSTGGSVTTEEFKDKEKVDSSSFVSDVDPLDPEGEEPEGASDSGANTMFALVAIIAGCWAL